MMYEDEEVRKTVTFHKNLDAYMQTTLPALIESNVRLLSLMRNLHYLEGTFRNAIIAFMADYGLYELELDLKSLKGHALSWGTEIDENGQPTKIKFSLVFPEQLEKIMKEDEDGG